LKMAKRGQQAQDKFGPEEQCTICMYTVVPTEAMVLACGHGFHRQCIQSLRAHGVGDACPQCRAALPPCPERFYFEAVSLVIQAERIAGSYGLGRAASDTTKPLYLKAEVLLNQTIRENATSSKTAQKLLATVLLKIDPAGNVDHSVACAQRAVELDPTSRTFTTHGISLLYQKGFKPALVCFEQAVALDQNDAVALYHKGACLLELGDIDLALSVCRHAVAVIDRFPRRWTCITKSAANFNLGQCCKKAGDYPSAIRAFQDARTADPADADTHYELGQSLARIGDMSTAVASFKQAEELGYSPEQLYLGSSYGVLLASQGEFTKALVVLAYVAEHQPDAANLSNHAAAMLDTGDAAGAHDVLQRAYGLNTKNQQIAVNLATCKNILGFTTEGTEMLHSVVKYLTEKKHITQADRSMLQIARQNLGLLELTNIQPALEQPVEETAAFVEGQSNTSGCKESWVACVSFHGISRSDDNGEIEHECVGLKSDLELAQRSNSHGARSATKKAKTKTKKQRQKKKK
jgi:tetratricopeptide (TPR) repeat protein